VKTPNSGVVESFDNCKEWGHLSVAVNESNCATASAGRKGKKRDLNLLREQPMRTSHDIWQLEKLCTEYLRFWGTRSVVDI